MRWTAQGGAISRTGIYRAGSTGGSFRLVASLEGQSDTVTVTVMTPIPAPAPVPIGSLLYDAHFENGVWPRGTIFDTCDTVARVARLRVYSNDDRPAGAPAARMGRYAVAMTVLDTDVEPCTPTENPRATAQKEKIFHAGDEIWEAYSIYIPVGFPNVPWFMMLEEDYGSPYHSSPPNGLYLQNWDGSGNRWYMGGDYDGATKSWRHVWDGPVVTTGVWHDFMVHKRFATDKTGWLELWFDGQQVTFYNGQKRLMNQQTMLSGATAAGFQLMHYRRAGMFPVSKYPSGLTIYFDEARVGTTREAVEQGR